MKKDRVSIPRKAARQLISQYPARSLTNLKKIYRDEFKRVSLAWGSFITKNAHTRKNRFCNDRQP